MGESPPQPRPSPPPPPPPLPTSLRTLVDQLHHRQSYYLPRASCSSLPAQKRHPKNYDQWFAFAKSRECLIDEYDQIYRDFEPFYQLVGGAGPQIVQEDGQAGSKMAIAENLGMKTFEVERGVASLADDRPSDGWMWC
ncbi:hypothetical protein B0H13DRAFT_698311 [Mycena leptocephala]|nr:hypothetical protein B0H13DRAFT_698311 [Mycena leptocephala]